MTTMDGVLSLKDVFPCLGPGITSQHSCMGSNPSIEMAIFFLQSTHHSSISNRSLNDIAIIYYISVVSALSPNCF